MGLQDRLLSSPRCATESLRACSFRSPRELHRSRRSLANLASTRKNSDRHLRQRSESDKCSFLQTYLFEDTFERLWRQIIAGLVERSARSPKRAVTPRGRSPPAA